MLYTKNVKTRTEGSMYSVVDIVKRKKKLFCVSFWSLTLHYT